MGGLSVVVASVALALRLELRFIDAPTMAVMGLGMAAVGAWQRALGHRFQARR